MDGNTAHPAARPHSSSQSVAPEFKRLVTKTSPASRPYMSWRTCPVCGGERHRLVVEYENFQFYTDAEISKQTTVRQVQCLHCFGVFMNPVFNDFGFSALLAEAGASYGSTPARYGEQATWLIERELLKPKATLLDIGCYEGTFIGKLPSGVRGIGVDIDECAVERARRHFAASSRHRFLCADFEKIEVDEPIDVITMFHVFEHLPRPVAVLRRLAQLATSQTRLVIEVPVFEHVDYGDVCGFLSVLHLTHFSVSSLCNVLDEGGWRIVSRHVMDGYNGLRIVAEPAPCSPHRSVPDDVGAVSSYLSRWYDAVAKVETRLQRIKSPYCVMRGGGLQTEHLFHLTSLFARDREFLIVDGDKLKQNRRWRGIPIVGPEHLPAVDWRATQMVLSSYSHQDAMRQEARDLGIPHEAVVSLYDQTYRC